MNMSASTRNKYARTHREQEKSKVVRQGSDACKGITFCSDGSCERMLNEVWCEMIRRKVEERGPHVPVVAFFRRGFFGGGAAGSEKRREERGQSERPITYLRGPE